MQLSIIMVRETANKIAKKGESGLGQKEAGELLVGDEEKYEKPILEGEGYQIGYEWAKRRKDLDKFEEFYNECNEGRLN